MSALVSSKGGFSPKFSTSIMGVLNVTPDSFSDGGLYCDPDKAYQRALNIEEEGADVLDIGGESTRPGALPVSPEDELARILPVLKKIAKVIKIPISIDTRHAEVARVALNEGATWVNDVSGLKDPKMGLVVSQAQATIVLMHMQGEPQTMQENPQYQNVVYDVFKDLQNKIELAQSFMIKKEKIIVDPGIGFGKTFEHNLEIFKNIEKFRELGCPVMLGFSKKRMVKSLFGDDDASLKRGNLILSALAAQKSVSWIRVHDVKETKTLLNALKKLGEIS